MTAAKFNPGDRVEHQTYGVGTVRNYSPIVGVLVVFDRGAVVHVRTDRLTPRSDV